MPLPAVREWNKGYESHQMMWLNCLDMAFSFITDLAGEVLGIGVAWHCAEEDQALAMYHLRILLVS